MEKPVAIGLEKEKDNVLQLIKNFDDLEYVKHSIEVSKRTINVTVKVKAPVHNIEVQLLI